MTFLLNLFDHCSIKFFHGNIVDNILIKATANNDP